MLAWAAGALGAAVLGAAGAIWRRRRRLHARTLYQQHLERALEDGILTGEEARELEQLRAAERVSDTEARIVSLTVYRRALREVGADARVTAEEDARLIALQEQLGLREHDLREDRFLLQRLRLLARIERGELPELDTPLELSPGEACHWLLRATLCHRIALAEREPLVGVTLTVDSGSPFQVDGRRDALEAAASLLPIDLGLLAVTDRRLLYQGAKRRFSIPHLQLRSIVLYSDGIRVEPARGEPQVLLVDDPELTAATLLLASRKRRRAVLGSPAA